MIDNKPRKIMLKAYTFFAFIVILSSSGCKYNYKYKTLTLIPDERVPTIRMTSADEDKTDPSRTITIAQDEILLATKPMPVNGQVDLALYLYGNGTDKIQVEYIPWSAEKGRAVSDDRVSALTDRNPPDLWSNGSSVSPKSKSPKRILFVLGEGQKKLISQELSKGDCVFLLVKKGKGKKLLVGAKFTKDYNEQEIKEKQEEVEDRKLQEEIEALKKKLLDINKENNTKEEAPVTPTVKPLCKGSVRNLDPYVAGNETRIITNYGRTLYLPVKVEDEKGNIIFKMSGHYSVAYNKPGTSKKYYPKQTNSENGVYTYKITGVQKGTYQFIIARGADRFSCNSEISMKAWVTPPPVKCEVKSIAADPFEAYKGKLTLYSCDGRLTRKHECSGIYMEQVSGNKTTWKEVGKCSLSSSYDAEKPVVKYDVTVPESLNVKTNLDVLQVKFSAR